jgi:hypothetical protein
MESTQSKSHDAHHAHDTNWEGFLAEDPDLRPFYEDVYLGANNDATIMSETDAIPNNDYADEMYMDLLDSLDTNTEEHIPGHSDTEAGGVARDLAYLGGYHHTADELTVQDPADTTITQAPFSSGCVSSHRESSVAGFGPLGPDWSLEAHLQPGLPPLPLQIDGFGFEASGTAPPETVIQYDQRPAPHDLANFNQLLHDQPFQAHQPNAQLSHILQDTYLDQMQPYQAHTQVPAAILPSFGFVSAGNLDHLSHVQPVQQGQTIDMEPLQPIGTFASPDQAFPDTAVYFDPSHGFPPTVVDDMRQYEGFGRPPADPSFSAFEISNRTTDLIHVPVQKRYLQLPPTLAGDGVGLCRDDVALPANTPISASQSLSQSSYANSALPVQPMTENQPPVYGPAGPSQPSNSRPRKAEFPKTTMTQEAEGKSKNARALSKHKTSVQRGLQERTGAPGEMFQTLSFGDCVRPFAPPRRIKGNQKDGKKRRTCILCWLNHAVVCIQFI